MLKQSDYGVPFTERRDSFELYKIPYYEEQQGVAPRRRDHFEHRRHVALADLMNNGKYNGKQILPPKLR
jgi:hypothetical protein